MLHWWVLIDCILLAIPFPSLAKFFDGMDDDGSEFIMQYPMLFSITFLDSPFLRFMITNGDICFRSSKQWRVRQEAR